MDFLSERSPSGAMMWVASVVRSQLGEGDLKTMVHNGGRGHTELWWGPIVTVLPRSRITYFETSMGLMIEAVEAPPPMLEQSAPSTTTVRIES